MQDELRQKLSQVIQNMIDGDQDKGKENFKDYITQKSRDILSGEEPDPE